MYIQKAHSWSIDVEKLECFLPNTQKQAVVLAARTHSNWKGKIKTAFLVDEMTLHV